MYRKPEQIMAELLRTIRRVIEKNSAELGYSRISFQGSRFFKNAPIPERRFACYAKSVVSCGIQEKADLGATAAKWRFVPQS
jgi:hypothetical protein